MKRIYVMILAAMLAVAPVLAEARAGSSYSSSRSYSSPSRSYSSPSRSYSSTPSYSYRSQGSAGTRTYSSSPTYQPTQRSATPPSSSYSSSYRPGTGVAAPTAAGTAVGSSTTVNHTTINHGGSSTGSTFMAAAGGAALGSMIGNGLSGPHYVGGGYGPGYVGGGAPVVVDGGGYAGGAPVVAGGGYAGAPVVVESGTTFATVLGNILLFFIVMALIVLIVWGLLRLLRSKQEEPLVIQTETKRMTNYDDESFDIDVTNGDRTEFKNVLARIQKAWSERDTAVLHGLLTTEMYEYFCEALDDNTAQGVVNRVEDVTDIECDVLEAWSDTYGDFARAIMRWKAHDFTTDLNGKVIDDGTTGFVKETWTFKRQYGAWILSAVNQMD